MQDVGWQLLIFIVFWVLSIKKNENHCHTGFKRKFRFLWLWNLRAALHLQSKWLDKQNCGWQAGNTSNDKQNQSPSQGRLMLSSSTTGWLASLGALYQLLAFNSIFHLFLPSSACPALTYISSTISLLSGSKPSFTYCCSCFHFVPAVVSSHNVR